MPDNTLPTAQNLGNLNSTLSIADVVNSGDTVDFYRFNLTGTSDVNIALTGLTADANIRLIRDLDNDGVVDANEVIASSSLTGTNSDSINVNALAAGNYFVAVDRVGNNNTNYTLRLSPSGISNLIVPEANLGNISATPILQTGFVGNADTSDFYSFNLASAGDINLSLTELSANANFRLIRDANGNGVVDGGEVLANSTNGGSTPDSINLNNQAAGTYLVQVYQAGNGNTNYTLRLSNSEPSNLIAQEANLGNLAVTPTTRTGFIGNADTSDIYRFSLAFASDINISLTGLSSAAGFRLIRDANNNGIIDTDDGGGGGPIELIADEVIVDSFSGFNFGDPINVNNQAAGNYFVQVYQFASNENETNYTLRLSNDGISNLLDTRDNFGTLSITPVSRRFVVDDLDTSDIYRFNLAVASDINIALNDLTADADVRLIRDANGNGVVDNGEVVASSTRGSTFNDVINLNNQAAGDYFVQVYQFSPGAIGYHLSVSNSDPSNLLAEEENLGNISTTPITRTGFVGNSNTSDMYRFSLAFNSDINLALTGMTADADLRLYRDDNFNDIVDAGEQIAVSARAGAFDDAINLNQQLAAGNYFAQVHQFSGETNYNLRLSTDQPSSLLAVQENLGVLGGANVRRFDSVGNNDTSDIYRFSLDSQRLFGVEIAGLTADADLRVIRDFNGNGTVDVGEEIARSARGGTSSDFLNLFLDAGDYFAQVYQFSGEANYQLTVA